MCDFLEGEVAGQDARRLDIAAIDALAEQYDAYKVATINLLAACDGRRLEAAQLIYWVETSVLPHLTREKDCLLPLLSAHTQSEDDLGALIALLGRNYEIGFNQVALLQGAVTNDQAVPGHLYDDIVDLASRERQHVALFTAIALPILRLRLDIDGASD